MISITEEPMKIRKDDTNDVRLALLEQSINNINETMIRMEKKIDKGFDQVDKRFDKIEIEVKEFKKEINSKIESFNSRLWVNFYWILGTMFTLSCAGAGILAKGFGWLK